MTEGAPPPRRARPRWRCVPTHPSGLTARLLELLLTFPGAAGESTQELPGKDFRRGAAGTVVGPPDWPYGILKRPSLEKVFL